MAILCGTCNEEIPVDHASNHRIDANGVFKSYHFGCGIVKPRLVQNEKLDLLNSIEVIESDGDGECLYYVHIENTEENRSILFEIGVSEGEIKEMTDDEDKIIDISMIAFNNTNAQWFQEDLGGFLDYEPKGETT